MEVMDTERLGSIINEIPYGLLLVNESGSIIWHNSKALEILSLPSSQIVKQSFADIFSNDYYLRLVLKTGTSIEDQPLQLNGKLLLTSFTVNKQSRDAKEVICTFRDASEMEKISNRINDLELLNAELETIINSSFDEIFVIDGEGTVLKVNPAGEALYGVKAEEIIGINTSELAKRGFFSPSLYPIIIERKERVSMIQRTRAGKTVHVIGNPVFNQEGNISLIIYTSRDLTEIRYLKDKIEKTETLLHTYKSELEELKGLQDQDISIVAFSPNMRKIIRIVNKISTLDSTVLITGESGVGKGLIAYTIHKNSHKKGRFIHINCGAIPETLIESELFGYEGGAFTGAKKEGYKGLIEQANGGTLFLDEIGEMPAHLQVKLLNALQDRRINRIGSSKSKEVEVRIIAATNQDLEKLISKGKFREDLYYRLNVIPIHIPPLRNRPEDISYLINHFINKYNEKYNLSIQLSLEAENTLMQYNWPGNVRELENMIERLIVTTDNKQITLMDIPDYITKKAEQEYFVTVNKLCALKKAQEEMEEQLIRKAYDLYKSSYKVSEILGVNQSTIIRKMKKYK